jgi:hypothetical protein
MATARACETWASSSTIALSIGAGSSSRPPRVQMRGSPSRRVPRAASRLPHPFIRGFTVTRASGTLVYGLGPRLRAATMLSPGRALGRTGVDHAGPCSF